MTLFDYFPEKQLRKKEKTLATLKRVDMALKKAMELLEQSEKINKVLKQKIYTMSFTHVPSAEVIEWKTAYNELRTYLEDLGIGVEKCKYKNKEGYFHVYGAHGDIVNELKRLVKRMKVQPGENGKEPVKLK